MNLEEGVNEMTESDRRLAAIMFTDMVGYSALTHKDERLANELLSDQKSILLPLVDKYAGRIVKSTGDGYLIEFSSAQKALHCAIEFQGVLQSHNIANSDERQINVRIGIHLGEIEERDGDIYGDGVNIAARIEPLSAVGGIAVSAQVIDQVRGKFRTEFSSAGFPALKGIDTPIEVFQVSTAATLVSQIEKQVPKLFPNRAMRIGILAGLIAIVTFAGWLIFSQDSVSPVSELDDQRYNSIAVLPFIDLSPEKNNEYFSEGLSEELIHALSKVDGLRVPGRTSSFSFKDKDLPIKEIARELDVEVILEGSVRKNEETVRITAQLIRVADDHHIMSEVFDRKIQDIFQVQEELARKILESMNRFIAGSDIALFNLTTESHEAYEAYLQGLYHSQKPGRTRESIELAMDYFHRAIEIDPTYAEAYAGLSRIWINAQGYFKWEEVISNAEVYALKAYELDPNIVESNVSLAIVHRFKEEYVAASERLDFALKLDPNNADVYYVYGSLLTHLGECSKALPMLEKAVRLEPLLGNIRNALAICYLFLKEYEAAVTQFEKAIELGAIFAVGNLAWAYRSLWQWSEAEEQYLKLIELDSENPRNYRQPILFLTELGRFDEAFELLRTAQDLGDEYSLSYYEGMLYLFTRDYDRAIESFLDNRNPQIQLRPVALVSAYVLSGDYDAAQELISTEMQQLLQGRQLVEQEQSSAIPLTWQAAQGVLFAVKGEDNNAFEVIGSLENREYREGLYYVIALIYAWLGELNSAFEWLERSFEERERPLVTLIADPIWDPIRDDPRYATLLERLNLEP